MINSSSNVCLANIFSNCSNVTIPGKSVVGFALFDDSGLATTSPNFTVADPFTLNSPNSTEYNLPMSIAWLGGVVSGSSYCKFELRLTRLSPNPGTLYRSYSESGRKFIISNTSSEIKLHATLDKPTVWELYRVCSE